MKSTKKLSGELLLYFYAKQRQRGFNSHEIMRFTDWDNIKLVGQSGMEAEVAKLSSNYADLYNAILYLGEKGYLYFKQSRNSGGDMIHSFRVTAPGVDIIEGVERDTAAKQNFTVNFNIKVADNITVESLIKNELGSVFKGSLWGL